MAVSEFDAFGPWIYPVEAAEDAPALFRPLLREGEPWELCLKVPRNIERRRASPDMDLYDHLLCAYPDRVVLLHRGRRGVERREVPYGAVCRVGLARKLLQGRLTLHLAEGAVTVPFNAVSMERMQAFARVLRRHAAPGGTLPAFREAPVTDPLLKNILEDLRREGETFAVGAFQERAPLRPLEDELDGGPRRDRGQAVMPALAVLAGEGEILLLRREAQAGRDRGDGLGYAMAFLPLGQVQSLRLEDDREYQARRLTATLRCGVTVCRFARDNPQVKGCYAALRALL